MRLSLFIAVTSGLLAQSALAAEGAVTPLEQQMAHARALYVDALAPTGGDGSARAPFRSIAEALAVARPGTRVLVGPGAYGAVGSIVGLQGTERAPIAIVGSNDTSIDAQGAGTGIHLVSPRHVVIEGLSIRNAFPHGMSIDDGGAIGSAHHVVLRRLSFSGIGNGGNNDCLKLSGVDDFNVEASSFSACNAGEGIDMVGCHRGVITGSTFMDMPGIAIQTKGGSSDVLVHGNQFMRIGQRAVNAGGATGARWFRPISARYEAERIRIVSNVIRDTGSAPVVYSGCNQCVFANNTVVNPGDFVARIVRENPNRDAGEHGWFVNNVLLFDPRRLRDYVDVRPGTSPATFTFGWNLWSAGTAASFEGPVYGGGLRPERHPVVTGDPRLDDSLRPLPSSPAVGAGRAVPGGTARDFDHRDYGTPPAIGAFAGHRASEGQSRTK